MWFPKLEGSKKVLKLQSSSVPFLYPNPNVFYLLKGISLLIEYMILFLNLVNDLIPFEVLMMVLIFELFTSMGPFEILRF